MSSPNLVPFPTLLLALRGLAASLQEEAHPLAREALRLHLLLSSHLPQESKTKEDSEGEPPSFTLPGGSRAVYLSQAPLPSPSPFDEEEDEEDPEMEDLEALYEDPECPEMEDPQALERRLAESLEGDEALMAAAWQGSPVDPRALEEATSRFLSRSSQQALDQRAAEEEELSNLSPEDVGALFHQDVPALRHANEVLLRGLTQFDGDRSTPLDSRTLRASAEASTRIPRPPSGGSFGGARTPLQQDHVRRASLVREARLQRLSQGDYELPFDREVASLLPGAPGTPARATSPSNPVLGRLKVGLPAPISFFTLGDLPSDPPFDEDSDSSDSDSSDSAPQPEVETPQETPQEPPSSHDGGTSSSAESLFTPSHDALLRQVQLEREVPQAGEQSPPGEPVAPVEESQD